MHLFHNQDPLRSLVWILLGILAAAPLRAQTTNLEMVAAYGGHIIGAAKACGINSERIRRTSERMLGIVNAKAVSAEERKSATRLFASAQGDGAEEMRLERSRCSGVHVDFSEIEVKLGRAPAIDNDAVTVRRGVPALGALPPEAVGGSLKR
ncbi:MAG: hypothetical protein EXR29_02855 [Betaproteobacteria bacterium]|nr:hypothetical protein [Betaproteobacteria bacterium]